MGAWICAIGAFAAAGAWFAAGAVGCASGLPRRERGRGGARELVERAVRAASAAARGWEGRLRALVPAPERPEVGAREVSDMVDVVRLGLKAGLAFDAALELFCAHREGVLSTRMRRALFSWQVGLATREDALRDAARDLGVPALAVFGSTVCQALAFGAPVAGALLAQSREIRDAHRAEVERAIERAPVKILIPTGTLILPALLLAILGPLLSASGMM